MKISWSKKAGKNVRHTASSIYLKFGHKASQGFYQKIQQASNILSTFPFIGKKEPWLLDCPVPYRSIVVNRLNKIVYYIDNDTIKIVDFWDVRREPKELVEGLEKTE